MTATNFGGAVRMAALPNRNGKAPVELGVPVRGEGLSGVEGVPGPGRLRESRPFVGPVDAPGP